MYKEGFRSLVKGTDTRKAQLDVLQVGLALKLTVTDSTPLNQRLGN